MLDIYLLPISGKKQKQTKGIVFTNKFCQNKKIVLVQCFR